MLKQARAALVNQGEPLRKLGDRKCDEEIYAELKFRKILIGEMQVLGESDPECQIGDCRALVVISGELGKLVHRLVSAAMEFESGKGIGELRISG